MHRAHFWWEGSGTTRRAAVAFSRPIVPDRRELERVWRVRMAALEPATGDLTRVGRVVWLLDAETEGRFVRSEQGTYEYRWTPTATELASLDRYCSPTGEATYATSIWFEDVVGHVGVPDELRWAPPPTLRVTVLPQRVPLEVPVQVTIQAVDVYSGAPVAGTVIVDDQHVGSTNAPFTWTFTSRWVEEFDPETRVRIRHKVYPSGRVTAPDYPEAAIPFEFFTPVLRRWVEPASIPLGPAVRVTVRSEDNDTRVAIAGRVTIGGRDVGATNAPFTHAFTAMPTTGTISAAGYPATSVTFPLYAPRLGVWVQPSPIVSGRPVQVTVWAEDATTRAPVGGRVRISGQDVGATNVPFTYTFAGSPPAGVVAAPYYPDAAIPWPPLRPPVLEATIQPRPVQLGVTATYTVRAVDDTTRAPVAGTVAVNGAAVAQTNVPFSYAFRVVRRRVRDPETGAYLYEVEYPAATASASGYPTAELDLGL